MAYSVRLKHVPVVDLFILASGFVLRVYAGAVAIRVNLSFWMFITTLCLALYLACGKRRQELVKSGTKSRAVLREYTAPLLDSYSSISEISAIVFYGLFVSTTRPELPSRCRSCCSGCFGIAIWSRRARKVKTRPKCCGATYR